MLGILRDLFSKTPSEKRVRSTATAILEEGTKINKAFKKGDMTEAAHNSAQKKLQSRMKSLNNSPDNTGKKGGR